ncbi:hypothetical protein MUK42_12018 [Musa troglodytarum]|uniref:Uncharacterized protein n=1 Tax=Musa troglodytarum TaxID=320322 RepID=A0A9E7GMW8_9LILI|nr:hypothetical protein MUK42_12018 [Musa troglodytarum]
MAELCASQARAGGFIACWLVKLLLERLQCEGNRKKSRCGNYRYMQGVLLSLPFVRTSYHSNIPLFVEQMIRRTRTSKR